MSDLSINMKAAADIGRYHALTVAQVIEETADAKSIVFDVPAPLLDAFAYKAGQFLTLRIPYTGEGVLRCYSLSSAPGIDTRLCVTVKRVAGGRASNWICDELRVGSTVDVLPPAGVFVPRSLDEDVLLLAGGSGITPVLSIAKTVLEKGEGKVTLVYANRDEKSIIFGAALRELGKRHPNRLTVLHWLDSVQGVPGPDQLQTLLAPWERARCFICGPAAFMETARVALTALDVPRDRIHIERFVSLDAAPAADVFAPAAPGEAGSDSALEVLLDGATHSITAGAGETLLDSMLRAGLQAPHSCRTGSCGACMCKIEEGEVKLRGNNVLDSDDLADGWTLACQGSPASVQVRVRFPD
ncbi:MAG TPA: ferredoxin--NADP reductase [Noviherbaspirillum sp.]|nr:ferredoxin--NADP reductase [Noviherbaspirillum sp.]